MQHGKKIRKLLFNLLWLILAVMILFFISGIVITRKFDKELQEFAVNQINERIETKISVESVHISFFSRVPYVSVVFNDVITWSSNNFDRSGFNSEGTDTLFAAEKVYLQLNMFDVLRGKNRIKRIYAVNGKINMLTDPGGQVNYRVVKDVEPESKGKSKPFELEGLRISNFNFRLVNLAKNVNARTHVDDLLLKGRFSNTEFALGVSTGVYVHTIEREGISYITESDIGLKMVLDVKGDIAQIEKGELRLKNIILNTRGSVDFRETPELNLFLEGRSVDMNTLLNALPEKQRKALPLEINGNADVALKVEGAISTLRTPEIKAVYVFNIDNLKYRGENFRNLQVKGKYDNGRFRSPASTSIEIEKFYLLDRNSELEGSMIINNLLSPELILKIHGFMEAENLTPFIDAKDPLDLSGVIEPDFNLVTKLGEDGSFSLSNILNGEIEGKLNLVNLGFNFNEHNFQNLNGNMNFKNSRWGFDIGFDYNSCPVLLKAQADYFLEWLFTDKQSLWARAAIRTGQLNLDPFFPEEEKISDEPGKGFFLPGRVFLKASAEFESLEYRNFMAEDINTEFSYKPKILDFSSYSMKCVDGEINGELTLFQDEHGDLLLKTDNIFDKLDINKLFLSFNNFNQDFLTDENIQGKLSGTTLFSMSFDSLLNSPEEDIYSDINITIYSGELNDFEPARSLSRFVELSELEHIQFSEMTNNILIRDRNIYIPQMNINSSAFDITVSGTHSFDNQFDYRLKVNLSDILAGKAKNKLENQENFVVEEDTRRASLFLSITGTPDDFQVKYDKKQAITNIREGMKEEKSTIKQILNEEFGWFKKDSAEFNPPGKNKQPEFIIKWDEDINSTPPDTTRSRQFLRKKKKEGEDFRIEWDEDDG